MKNTKKHLANPKVILWISFVLLILVVGLVWALSSRLSADDITSSPTECTPGTYSNYDPSAEHNTGLSMKAYQVQVLTKDGAPSEGKAVSISTTYVKNLTTNSTNVSGVIAEGATNKSGKIELRIPYCLATVNNATKFFLGNGSSIFVGDIVIKVEGFTDKVVKNSLIAKGFTSDQYKSFIAVSTLNYKEPKSPSTVSAKPNAVDNSLINPSQASTIGSNSFDAGKQSSDLQMTVVGTIKDPKTNKTVDAEVRVPYAKVDVSYDKAPSGNKSIPYYYFLKYSYNGSPMHIKKIFVWKYTDSTQKTKKIITQVYLSYPFKASQDFQAENYFKGEINILNDNVQKYIAKNPSANLNTNSNKLSNANTNANSNLNAAITPASNLNTNTNSVVPKKTTSKKSSNLFNKIGSWLSRVLGS